MKGRLLNEFAHAVIIPTDGWSCKAVAGLSQNVMASTQNPLNMMDGNLRERELYEKLGCCCVWGHLASAGGQRIQPRWSQCSYPERPLRTAVLWRSMSSLCVSIKIRQFWMEGGHASSNSLFCPLRWKSRNQRTRPFIWEVFKRTSTKTHFAPRVLILRTIKITFHPRSLFEAFVAGRESRALQRWDRNKRRCF